MMGGGGGMEEIPDMAALMALDPPYVATENVEYTPLRAPASGPAVMDIGMGLIKTSATACAQECSDTDGCNMATWTGNVPVRSQPCRLVALISFACLFDGA